MILSDRDIEIALREGHIVIEPLDDPENQIQPASVDLRLGEEFILIRPKKKVRLKRLKPSFIDTADLTTAEEFTTRVTAKDGFILKPGEFALGTTLERVVIPEHIAARVEGRSSLGRLGIVVHATAGYLDPGFEGQVTLELSNLGEVPVKLYPGRRVCQVVFQEMKTPCRRPYGPERGSKYWGQSGVQQSKVSEDLDATNNVEGIRGSD